MSDAVRLRLSDRAQCDLVRLEQCLFDSGDPLAQSTFDFLLDGLHVLTHQPGIGRPMGGGVREGVLSRGKGGYLARYHFDVSTQVVRILRIRHQRESGYTEDEI